MPTLFDIPAAPPPSVAHSPTSRAAASEIIPVAGKQRRDVFELLKFYPDGLTDEQIAERLGLNPSSARPRRVECVKAGLVIDSGRTRKTRAGRRAVVWEAVKQ